MKIHQDFGSIKTFIQRKINCWPSKCSSKENSNYCNEKDRAGASVSSHCFRQINHRLKVMFKSGKAQMLQ
uniref:Uncharacterized protein n=1 Tax=Romanomermis culicivorax TaxID=13658 RepID=A0A915J8E3_ROMCU